MRGAKARGKGGDSADRGRRGRGEIAVGGGGFELNLRHGARREGRGDTSREYPMKSKHLADEE